ncbi:MAG: hypothetical protein LAP40_03675 [Acidobacteriia bacterium]|nr:hypothetical protein [Terriglobia bacterium]
MRVSPRLLTALLLIPALWGQPSEPAPSLQVHYIPALAYGPSEWSILKLTNASASVQSVTVDVYGESGDRLPIGPAFTAEPGATLDVRVEDSGAATSAMAWARVTAFAGLDVQAFVEILQGNAIEDFARRAHSPSADSHWVSRASVVQGKQLYFLNVAEHPTFVTFCAVNNARQASCPKGPPAARYPVNPGQAVSVEVGRLGRRYFLTESSAPGAAILALFDEGQGIRKLFSSKSDIRFGEALP